jgi:hypothetical protein
MGSRLLWLLKARQTGRVLPPQIPLPDVAPDHLGRAVARLGHDNALGGAAGSGAGGESSAQVMASVSICIQARLLGATFHNQGHPLGRQALGRIEIAKCRVSVRKCGAGSLRPS